MARRQGLKCARCGQPIRKGQGLVVTSFATANGLTAEGQPHVSPWLTVVQHLRSDATHQGFPGAEIVREAKKYRITSTPKPSTEDGQAAEVGS